MKRLVDNTVPIYGPHTPSDAQPDFKIPYATARLWLLTGVMSPINRGTAARLNHKVLPRLKVRDVSCCPSENVMIAAADNEPWAKAVVNAWHEKMRVYDRKLKPMPAMFEWCQEPLTNQ